jgi:hypothetical protein
MVFDYFYGFLLPETKAERQIACKQHLPLDGLPLRHCLYIDHDALWRGSWIRQKPVRPFAVGYYDKHIQNFPSADWNGAGKKLSGKRGSR